MQPPQAYSAFLSMPYGKDDKARAFWKGLRDAIVKAAGQLESPTLSLKVADERVASLILKRSVARIIDECDFTVAVITEQNPNVYWEVGYTEARGKPVVYLVEEGVAEANSPVLVLEALKCVYPRGLLDHPEQLATRLEPFLIQAIKTVKSADRAPEVKVFGSREAINLPGLVASAEHHIYLITTNLLYFADQERFSVVHAGAETFAFDIPVASGVELRILALDPESPIVKYRAEQLGYDFDVGIYRDELRRGAQLFFRRYAAKRNVSIRLYDDLPTMISLLVDKRIVTSVVSRGSRSRNDLHFLIDDSVGGAGVFRDHFFQVDAAAGNRRHISAFRWAYERDPATGQIPNPSVSASNEPLRPTLHSGAKDRE
jgi:nucleoside 2-deoxyribosyltransferase